MKKLLHKIFTFLITIKRYNIYKSLGLSFNTYYRLFLSQRTAKQSVLFGKQIMYTNKFWYKHGIQELFIDKTYWFKSDKKSPLIIDCGANIGLSIIYFKRLFPEAKIIGFEPDEKIFKILEENLSQFEFQDIALENKAVWVHNEGLNFRTDGAVGGNLLEKEDTSGTAVKTARLNDYLDQDINFLKIDIEGAEFDVLNDCRDLLVNVENIFVEYHSSLKDEQNLSSILQILSDAGFRYYIKEAWENMKYPYIDKKGLHFDLQLNIFGYRI